MKMALTDGKLSIISLYLAAALFILFPFHPVAGVSLICIEFCQRAHLHLAI